MILAPISAATWMVSTRWARVLRRTSGSSLIKLIPSMSTMEALHSKPLASMPFRISAAGNPFGRNNGSSTPSKPPSLIRGNRDRWDGLNSAVHMYVVTPNFISVAPHLPMLQGHKRVRL